jgi:protein-tyrosine phosphatase
MIRMLFVCTGNICRSPMAEGVFLHLVEAAGLNEQITADSAGTIGYHVGEQAHSGTRKVLQKNGIAYDGRSRQVTSQDFADFDYLLAMDQSHYDALISKKPDGTSPVIRLFLEYAEGVSNLDMPDPYYNGNFEQVYRLVDAGAHGLLAAIRSDHNI